MNHLDIFSGRGLMMIGILVASSVLTMVVTAHATEWITVLRTGSRSRSKITVAREKGSEA
ncbi:hypothetical protein D3C87_2032670 [compost metagenome]